MQELVPTQFSWLPKWLMPLDFLGLFEKDPFNNSLLIKRFAIFTLGWITYWRLTVMNRIRIEGTEYLEDLPECNVLFLSNHQTYFADVMALYQIFCSLKWGFKNTIVPPLYLLSPRARSYYVAAGETMKAGFIPRIFSLAGAITVERSWRAEGKNTNRELDTSAGDKIGMALKHGWIVSFPQGTTSPYAPVRKGTGYLIKENDPIVVPVVINGFRRAFDKKGLRLKKPNTILSVKFSAPIRFDKDATIEDIIARVRKEIGQEIPYDKLTWMKDSDASKDKKFGY